MTEITFDTEGKIPCPMKGTATMRECLDCIYHTEANKCIYKDIFTEEGMGLNA